VTRLVEWLAAVVVVLFSSAFVASGVIYILSHHKGALTTVDLLLIATAGLALLVAVVMGMKELLFN
jgi:hypothetical protein